MPKLIKASDAESGAFLSFQRDVLEPPITTTAEVVQVEEPPDPQEEREAILAEARALAEQKVREAYVEGLRRGEAAGREQFQRSLAQCEAALAAAADAIKGAHQSFLDSLEPQVVRLAHAVASQILQREVATDRELIVRTVRRAIDSLAERTRLMVRLNPADMEAIRNHKVSMLEAIDGIEHLELIADDAISPGGCVAESETLQADARLELQLERALRAMLE